MVPEEPPNIKDLRSKDEAVSTRAWAALYPLLMEAGIFIARMRLSGQRFDQDREDLVSIAMQQFTRGFIGNEKSYNQIESLDDCLRMFRHIVRQRVKDYFRSEGRNREDYVDELPEIEPGFEPAVRFRLEELLPEVDRLQPDPPVPQVFRARFIEGWSTDEIAERMNLNRNNICTYFNKGLKTLRERLTRLEGNQS